MKRPGVLERTIPDVSLPQKKAFRRRAAPRRKAQAVFSRAAGERAILFPPLPQDSFDYVVAITPAGIVLSSDQSLPERLKTTPSDFIGSDIYAYFTPESAQMRRQAAQRVLQTREPLRYRDDSNPGRVYDTRILPLFDPDGGIASLAIFVTDITSERKALERRRKLSAAIEQAVEAVAITDTDFKIEYVNQSFEAMAGCSRREALGGGLDRFYKGRLQEDKFKRCAALLKNGEACSDRFLLVSRTGETCVCDQSISPVRARYGVILGYVCIWRDATQVSRLETQLRQAQKMEAIGALASGIAHDFNNILGPIMLHAELCLSKAAENDPVRASLPEILEAAKRARGLAQQLLYLGRNREKDAPIPFRLSSLVKECVKLLKPGLSPDIEVAIRLDCDSDMTLADPDHIHQVIMNLATNAADAMKDFGGKLTFRISGVEVGQDGWSKHPSLPAGNYLRLSVHDTGHGVNPACLEKIFEPFYSCKTTTGGTGLGLSVVRSIVARMRGAIEVESEPGLGATFHVLLPRSEDAASDAPAPKRRRPRSENPARILLVDDDEATAGGLASALKGLGYSVECRVTASEALAAFLRHPQGYDVAMVDLVMPHMNGLDLAAEMLRVRPAFPVILFSAYADKVSPREISQCGITAFLPKPFNLDELDRTIRGVRDEKEGAGERDGE